MMINKKFLNEATKRIDIVSANARGTIEQLVLSAPSTYSEEELFQYVSEHFPAVVESATEQAAVLGANAYNTYRVMEIGEEIEAPLATGYNPEIVRDISRNVSALASERKDRSIISDACSMYVDSAIMHSYANTMVEASYNDPKKPRFARVPAGGGCKFCMMLGSRGFVYLSRQSAGEFNRFHNFCRCNIVPSFEDVSVAGYDPDKLYERYKRGEFGTEFGNPNRISYRSVSAKMPTIERPLQINPTDAELPEKCYGGEWNQKEDMQDFLRAVFDEDDYVGTCAEFFDAGDRRVPTKGMYQRQAGYIDGILDRTGNVSSAVGRYRTQDGAYVRINPLDGRGVSDANVKSFKYALIEADVGTMESQYGFIKALNLPTQAVVTSGNKSVHALVRVDASDLNEYRERVGLLHAECKAAGYDVDAHVKNPSRFMRIPGVKRGNGRQCLVSTGEGAESWDAWRAWCQDNR